MRAVSLQLVDWPTAVGSMAGWVVSVGRGLGVKSGVTVGLLCDAVTVGEGVVEGTEVRGTGVFVGCNIPTSMGSDSGSDLGAHAVNPPSMSNRSRINVYPLFIELIY
jgi:hypothetical protein